MFDPANRGQFLNLAAVFEGSLIVAALLVGWAVDVAPLERLSWEWAAVGWGVAATIPVFLLFLVSQGMTFGPFVRIKRFLIEMLGPSLHACTWYDLLLLAALAGFSEEVLFRGLLQSWLAGAGPWTGLVLSNILFGLAHMITLTYAVVAALIGCYLGLLYNPALVPGIPLESNLLVPIVTHALYDFLAFLVVRRNYRKRRQMQETPSPTAETESVGSDSKNGNDDAKAPGDPEQRMFRQEKTRNAAGPGNSLPPASPGLLGS